MNDCLICFDPVPNNKFVVLDCACNNRYHTNCMHEWITKYKICPSCRNPIHLFTIENERKIIETRIIMKNDYMKNDYMKKLCCKRSCMGITYCLSFIGSVIGLVYMLK